jgi:DNA polymerase-3 subunit epsilon
MFGDIWASQLERIVACNPVVAHNAGFDLSVLRACCEEHGIPFAKPASACTLKLARRLLPELPNHRLDTIARHLGVQLTHHEAESDAAACAEVAAEFCRMTNASSILEVESLPAPEPNPSRQVPVSMDMDEGLDSGIGPVVRTFDRGAEGIAIFIGWPYAVRHDVRGTSIVLTGKFAGLPRKDAIELLQEEGATVKSSVSRKTDILVVADKLWDAWQRGGYTTGKLSRALELREEGHRIQILAASDLFRIW